MFMKRLQVCAVVVGGMVMCTLMMLAPGACWGQDVQRIQVGGVVQAAKLTRHVQPVYPEAAKAAGIAGTVILHGVIGKDGSVKNLDFVSGPEELSDSAMYAVRQWEYQPTLVQGEPVEVDTTISVIYTLGAGGAGASADKSGAGSAQAQTQNGFTIQGGGHPFNKPPSIDPQFRADIEELMQVGHFDNTMTQMLTNGIEPLRAKMNAAFANEPNAKPILQEFFDRVIAVGQSTELKEAMIEIYAKYLTDEQVKKAVEFYKTEAGQQILATQMKIFDDARKVGESIFTERIKAIMKQMCSEHPEMGSASACR